jgi:speckle-type POZ protein
MTSEFFGTPNGPKMIVLYEWSFECVEEQPATIASKLILFRGKKVFRVGLKNHTLNPVLFFMVIDLGKIGMKVESIMYGFQGIGLGPEKMTEMINDNIGSNGGNLQLFTMTFLKKFVRKRTFVFRICIEGADPGFSYQLSDRLAKDQLGAALKSQQNLADVEFVVKDKTFPAHKSILAARSPVFAAEFEKKQSVVGGHQIRIEDVEPSTVENFLHFIYTGESIGTLADEELLQLADHYQLKTLTSLCKVALKKTDSMEMANLRKHLNSNPKELSSSKIM